MAAELSLHKPATLAGCAVLGVINGANLALELHEHANPQFYSLNDQE